MLITIIILAVSIYLFAKNVIPNDLVALLAAISLGLTGVLPPSDVFSGFSHPAVITIIAICVLAEALEKVGITHRLTAFLFKFGGQSERRLIAATMLCSATLSLFMNNIAAAALTLPVAAKLSKRSGVSIAKLGMPLAIGTLLGGMATLFTTMNIIVSSILRSQNLEGFGVFEFAPIGLPLLFIGVIYMVIWGRRSLPERSELENVQQTQEEKIDLIQIYGLGQTFTSLRINKSSPVNGLPISSTYAWNRSNVRIIALEHHNVVTHPPLPTTLVRAGDVITLQGDPDEIEKTCLALDAVKLPRKDWKEQDLESKDTAVFEVVLTPRSSLLGRTVREIRFREKYEMTILAIWRGNKQLQFGFQDVPLEFGDALLLQGGRLRLSALKKDPDLIYLGDEDDKTEIPSPKGKRALLIMAVVLIWSSLDSQRAAEIMLGGALLIAVTRVLDMAEFYRAIEWKTIFMVAGMLPMGIAVTNTGLGDQIGQAVIFVLGTYGPGASLAGFFIATILLTQVISGAASVTVMAPMAIAAAKTLHADPRVFAMAVALAGSIAFITPFAHPVHMLVVGPSGYTFQDYRKVGVPLTIIISTLTLILVTLML